MIESPDFKYIRQLPKNSEEPGKDILYDLQVDANEERNVADEPQYRQVLEEAQERRLAIHEKYPPCQTRWTIHNPAH
jgi:hypothetical protein